MSKPSVASLNLGLFFFLSLFIYFERAREREWGWGEGVEREGDRDPKQALCCQYWARRRTQSQTPNFEITVLPELKSRVGHLTNWATRVPQIWHSCFALVPCTRSRDPYKNQMFWKLKSNLHRLIYNRILPGHCQTFVLLRTTASAPSLPCSQRITTMFYLCPLQAVIPNIFSMNWGLKNRQREPLKCLFCFTIVLRVRIFKMHVCLLGFGGI